jgi:chemotaxis receptor (MCP) glutamine deamidase CheD
MQFARAAALSELGTQKRESLGRAKARLRAASYRLHKVRIVSKRPPVAKDLVEVVVAPDTYHVSPEPMLLVAELHGALGLCLHDEGRGVGGLLHLKFMGGTGRPSDVTDNTLSSVLAVLDRFKRGVLGNGSKRDDIQARILAHALPPTAVEPSASLVDLIQADLADSKIYCGSQTIRRTETLRVCFQPFEGRVWVCGPSSLGAAGAHRSTG